HSLVGDRDPPGEDDQEDEQHESGYAEHGLNNGGAALGVQVSAASHWVILSTGTAALWDTAGDQPGMTLRLGPVAVTGAGGAGGAPGMGAPGRTFLPPASLTKDDAADTPSAAVPFWLPAARAPSCAAAMATVRAW